MNISSRTPEGEPLRCKICGAVNAVEVSTAGDTLRPQCGSLLWKLSVLFSNALDVPAEQITLDMLERDFAADSLDIVEVVLALEDEWGRQLRDQDFSDMESVRDLLRWIRDSRRDDRDNSQGN